MAEDTRTPWVMSFRNFKSNVKCLNTVLSIIILCPTVLLLADSSWYGSSLERKICPVLFTILKSCETVPLNGTVDLPDNLIPELLVVSQVLDQVELTGHMTAGLI
jgi:hypothetical protein